MEQPLAVPQADVLWQSDDRTAKFYFTLQTHGNDDDAYSRYIAEGSAHAALPKVEPKVWEAISGHVQTFMARLNPPRQLGYSIDLKIPNDVDGRPEGTCTFGCGASEERLRQVRDTGNLPVGANVLHSPRTPRRWNLHNFNVPQVQQVEAMRRGLPPLVRAPSEWVTRSGLCCCEYDGRGRSMLIYKLHNPPVPHGQFHQLHHLPAWLVPLTYQDIILDMKERFPYLQAYTITVNFGTWNARNNSDLHFKVTSTERDSRDFIYERWNSYAGPMPNEKGRAIKFRRDYVVSKKFIPHGDEPTWPPHFDEAAAPTAEDFARKAAEIKAAVVAEIEHEQVEAVAQQLGGVNLRGPNPAHRAITDASWGQRS